MKPPPSAPFLLIATENGDFWKPEIHIHFSIVKNLPIKCITTPSVKRQIGFHWIHCDTYLDAWEWVSDWFSSVTMHSNGILPLPLDALLAARCGYSLKPGNKASQFRLQSPPCSLWKYYFIISTSIKTVYSSAVDRPCSLLHFNFTTKQTQELKYFCTFFIPVHTMYIIIFSLPICTKNTIDSSTIIYVKVSAQTATCPFNYDVSRVLLTEFGQNEHVVTTTRFASTKFINSNVCI